MCGIFFVWLKRLRLNIDNLYVEKYQKRTKVFHGSEIYWYLDTMQFISFLRNLIFAILKSEYHLNFFLVFLKDNEIFSTFFRVNTIYLFFLQLRWTVGRIWRKFCIESIFIMTPKNAFQLFLTASTFLTQFCENPLNLHPMFVRRGTSKFSLCVFRNQK